VHGPIDESEPFIQRPVATSLLMAAIGFVGIVSFPYLPVAPLPHVDFPTIQVSATLQGASAETMAASVAAPLERQFGQIQGVTQMTSMNTQNGTSIPNREVFDHGFIDHPDYLQPEPTRENPPLRQTTPDSTILAGALRRSRHVEHDRGVHPPLSPQCPAEWFPSHSQLRPPCERPSRGEACTLPKLAHDFALVIAALPIVLPEEADVCLIEIKQATVGDRDTMRLKPGRFQTPDKLLAPGTMQCA
jgi:hypothetical protein